MRLAQGGWMTVRDILALSRVPLHVVLSGCDTARAGPEARAAVLGLAQAFVVAGAVSVISATRPVDDCMAELFMWALYGASIGGDRFDAAASVREAALVVRGEAPASDFTIETSADTGTTLVGSSSLLLPGVGSAVLDETVTSLQMSSAPVHGPAERVPTVIASAETSTVTAMS